MKDADEIRRIVREHYGARAKQQLGSCCDPASAESSCCAPQAAEPLACCEPQADEEGSCCGPSVASEVTTHADRLYDEEELEGLPESITNVALGCGNPAALAELKPGDVVIDLGSGGGIDCFLAAAQVGHEGKVIGIDMTPEMVWLARENAGKIGVSNVEFRLGEMEHMPVESSFADVIISNCVINLSPDKDAVFKEAWRVLKPGGKLCVSDIVLRGELPQEIRENADHWAGCIAGAIHLEEYIGKIQAAGFAQVSVEDKGTQARKNTTPREQPEWFTSIASVRVSALKPL